jgi:hypothetical protein
VSTCLGGVNSGGWSISSYVTHHPHFQSIQKLTRRVTCHTRQSIDRNCTVFCGHGGADEENQGQMPLAT